MAYNLEIEPGGNGDFYAEPGEESVARGPQRLLRIGGALLVMGLFAGGLWFAYTIGTRHSGSTVAAGDIPLIRADARPIKVKPENPGGMQMPDRDMFIYGQQRPRVEHLLPPPEQPMARPTPPPPSPNPPPLALAPASSPPASVPPSPVPTPPVPAAAVPAPAVPAATAAMPFAETAPSPTAASTSLPPAPGSAASPSPEAEPAPAAPPAPPAAAKAAPRSDPIAEKIEQLAAAASSGAHQSAAARAGSATAGGVRLQLGALHSASEARAEGERLKRQNPDLLGHLPIMATRAELGDRGTFYRIQTGPVADASTAARICSELRQRHLACVATH